MASRLWDNPPLKPDGTLDYARLTTAEVAEDLYDGLGDRVYNGGHWELEPWLLRLDDFLPDYAAIPVEPAPTPQLIEAMEGLLRLEASDVNWYTTEARQLLGIAIEALRQLIVRDSGLAEPGAAPDPAA